MQHILFPVSDEKIRVLALGLPLSVELNADDTSEIVAYWLTREEKSAIFDLKKELVMSKDSILLSLAEKLPAGIICYETDLATLMTDRIYICQP